MSNAIKFTHRGTITVGYRIDTRQQLEMFVEDTGIGISIVANKVKGIRCALCADTVSARLTREHNDANMLAMGAGIIGKNLALGIVETFLGTPFSGEEKHARRVKAIE